MGSKGLQLLVGWYFQADNCALRTFFTPAAKSRTTGLGANHWTYRLYPTYPSSSAPASSSSSMLEPPVSSAAAQSSPGSLLPRWCTWSDAPWTLWWRARRRGCSQEAQLETPKPGRRLCSWRRRAWWAHCQVQPGRLSFVQSESLMASPVSPRSTSSPPRRKLFFARHLVSREYQYANIQYIYIYVISVSIQKNQPDFDYQLRADRSKYQPDSPNYQADSSKVSASVGSRGLIIQLVRCYFQSDNSMGHYPNTALLTPSPKTIPVRGVT